MFPTAGFREYDRRLPRVVFRLPEAELRKQLEDAAQAHDMTVSAFIRSLVLDALRKEREQHEFEESAVFFG